MKVPAKFWEKQAFCCFIKQKFACECHSIHDIFCIKCVWKGKLQANINKTVDKILRASFSTILNLFLLINRPEDIV